MAGRWAATLAVHPNSKQVVDEAMDSLFVEEAFIVGLEAFDFMVDKVDGIPHDYR